MTSKNHKQQPTTPAKLERLEGRLEVLFPTSEPDAYARIYREMGDRAEQENWSYRDFLALLLGRRSGAPPASLRSDFIPLKAVHDSYSALTKP